MGLLDILQSQLFEPFRIGLLAMMLFTAARTTQSVGTAIPVVLGIVFVAVLIPTSLGREDGMLLPRIGVGLVSNTLLVAVMLAAKALLDRARR